MVIVLSLFMENLETCFDMFIVLSFALLTFISATFPTNSTFPISHFISHFVSLCWTRISTDDTWLWLSDHDTYSVLSEIFLGYSFNRNHTIQPPAVYKCNIDGTYDQCSPGNRAIKKGVTRKKICTGQFSVSELVKVSTLNFWKVGTRHQWGNTFTGSYFCWHQ